MALTHNNFTTNTYLCSQPRCLSVFMICKTHIVPQKPRGRQLAKCKSVQYCIAKFVCSTTRFNNDISKMLQVLTVILSQNWCLSQHRALQSLDIFIATNSPWLIKLFTALLGCCRFCRTPFSNVIRMRTHSLVPKPKTMVIGLGARIAHIWNCARVDQCSIRLAQSLLIVVSKGYAVRTT